MRYLYIPVCNYPEEVIKQHYQGEKIGYPKFESLIQELEGKYLEIQGTRPRENRVIDVREIYENIDQFWKPFLKRNSGRQLIDELESGDELIFLGAAWSMCNTRDLHRMLEFLDRNRIEVFFIEEALCFSFFWNNVEHTPIRFSKFMKILDNISSGEKNFKRFRSQITHYNNKRLNKCRSKPPLGFTKNKRNVLIPDWDSQVLLKLISFLRDQQNLGWAQISRRIKSLYDKPGRHYPTASKARIPWSPQMCLKGYKAWKEIKNV